MADEIKGSEVDKITMIKIIKWIMVDLFRGYPAWKYYGIMKVDLKEILGILLEINLEMMTS